MFVFVYDVEIKSKWKWVCIRGGAGVPFRLWGGGGGALLFLWSFDIDDMHPSVEIWIIAVYMFLLAYIMLRHYFHGYGKNVQNIPSDILYCKSFMHSHHFFHTQNLFSTSQIVLF